MERSEALKAFKDRFGLEFKDEAVFEAVFIHGSFVNEAEAAGAPSPIASNERLEFLGDAVLGLMISHVLYERYPEITEGELTSRRARLVNRKALALMAGQMGLGELMLLGKGERASGGAANQTILAGVIEALIAAVYLDGGYEAAKAFVGRLFTPEVISFTDEAVHFDYKSMLQVAAQRAFKNQPEYRCIAEEGPPHRRVFTIEVVVNGQGLGKGTAERKKDAEQLAAKEALTRLDDGAAH